MSATISSINQDCNEYGGNTLSAGLLSNATKSSRNIWHRVFCVSVQISILNSVRRTQQHIVINISECTPEEVARIVSERDLNSLQKFGGGEQLQSRLQSYLEEQAKAKANLSYEEKPPAACIVTRDSTDNAKGFLFICLKACKTRTNFLLLLFAALSFTTEMMEQEIKYGWHDGVAILVTLLLLVTFRSVANYRARKLQTSSEIEVRVHRHGQDKTITLSSLVVGDILYLKKGDFVPADGLLVHGNGLELDDKLHPNINRDQNPFLFSGSEVIDGEGGMLVASVGADRMMDKALEFVTPNPYAKTLTEVQIDKTNAYMENVALSISLLVAVFVLINLVFRKQDKKSNILPELKGDVSGHMVIKILEMIFSKPRGKVQILTNALTAMVTLLQHGTPVAIAASLLHWKKKMELKGADVQNSSSCGTIGILSVICFDLTIEQMPGDIEVEQSASHKVMESVVEALRKARVSCKVVSKDELPEVKEMAYKLGILNPASVNEIAVIESCQPKDKIHILQRLKQEGHVVAFVGGMTTEDTPALKEADVGITRSDCSTKMAREDSEIVISTISSLSPILKMGGCAYGNIQTFAQIQLIASLSGLLVTLVTTIILDESPITGIHLIWVNCIICILGGLMMVMELQGQEQEVMNNPPARTETLLTKTMWRNVVIRVLSNAFYLLLLQFIGQAIIHMNNDVLNTMIFNVFTLSQVFIQFNAMGLPRWNAFEVICSSHRFLMAAGAIMVMQVLLIELLQSLADYEKLNALQWGFCLIYAAYLCGFSLALKYIADAYVASDESLMLNNSQSARFRRVRSWQGVLLLGLGIPFSLFLVASFSYYVNPDIAQTIR
ncbi:hypothetical protein PTKIN_Ptkin12aG0064800 [Pterospermum kingtungense]